VESVSVLCQVISLFLIVFLLGLLTIFDFVHLVLEYNVERTRLQIVKLLQSLCHEREAFLAEALAVQVFVILAYPPLASLMLYNALMLQIHEVLAHLQVHYLSFLGRFIGFKVSALDHLSRGFFLIFDFPELGLRHRFTSSTHK
jgi:hypothetical protein